MESLAQEGIASLERVLQQILQEGSGVVDSRLVTIVSESAAAVSGNCEHVVSSVLDEDLYELALSGPSDETNTALKQQEDEAGSAFEELASTTLDNVGSDIDEIQDIAIAATVSELQGL